jgi:hypothetical protein
VGDGGEEEDGGVEAHSPAQGGAAGDGEEQQLVHRHREEGDARGGARASRWVERGGGGAPVRMGQLWQVCAHGALGGEHRPRDTGSTVVCGCSCRGQGRPDAVVGRLAH